MVSKSAELDTTFGVYIMSVCPNLKLQYFFKIHFAPELAFVPENDRKWQKNLATQVSDGRDSDAPIVLLVIIIIITRNNLTILMRISTREIKYNKLLAMVKIREIKQN